MFTAVLPVSKAIEGSKSICQRNEEGRGLLKRKEVYLNKKYSKLKTPT